MLLDGRGLPCAADVTRVEFGYHAVSVQQSGTLHGTVALDGKR